VLSFVWFAARYMGFFFSEVTAILLNPFGFFVRAVTQLITTKWGILMIYSLLSIRLHFLIIMSPRVFFTQYIPSPLRPNTSVMSTLTTFVYEALPHYGPAFVVPKTLQSRFLSKNPVVSPLRYGFPYFIHPEPLPLKHYLFQPDTEFRFPPKFFSTPFFSSPLVLSIYSFLHC